MIRFLIRLAIFVVSSALGLLVTSWILDGFTIHASGFIVAVLVFTVVQSVIAPFVATMARRYASAFLGGVGLIATALALFIAQLFPGGLTLSGVSTWVLGTLLVWLISALGTFLLPFWWLREKRRSRTASPEA
ncbi:phage holin family protein [Paeniglutamicibacter sp. NPDC091659]|uniref:phage holin family protein n=1 Tax=Paeniglutamicibacter sp. NPDC091659 TaxID=3364389 RepID=UPI00380712B1